MNPTSQLKRTDVIAFCMQLQNSGEREGVLGCPTGRDRCPLPQKLAQKGAKSDLKGLFYSGSYMFVLLYVNL